LGRKQDIDRYQGDYRDFSRYWDSLCFLIFA
jgi:hypothetical protein